MIGLLEQLAGCLTLVLGLLEAPQTPDCQEFQKLRALATGDSNRLLQVRFSFTLDRPRWRRLSQ